MYLPPHFQVKDLEQFDVLAAHDAFATLVSQHEGMPFATHMPVPYRRDGADVTLLGHWARRNPQWQTLDRQTVLCILHGPHADVSPDFYPDPASRVPTWNYAAAHQYGRVRVKLHQNHPQANRDGVARAFLASGYPDARLLGRWMAAASGAQREPG